VGEQAIENNLNIFHELFLGSYILFM
jgi:hypothetical protein